MSTEAQAKTQDSTVTEKWFYYYPETDSSHPRRVLAGLVKENTIEVAEAVCHPGDVAIVRPIKLRNKSYVYIIDPGHGPDTFDKKVGKRLAMDRARGWKILDKGKRAGERVEIGKDILFEITLYPETESPGRSFVNGVEVYLREMGFPERPEKKKKEPKAPNESSTSPIPKEA